MGKTARTRRSTGTPPHQSRAAAEVRIVAREEAARPLAEEILNLLRGRWSAEEVPAEVEVRDSRSDQWEGILRDGQRYAAEREAYLRMLPELLETKNGKYVAVMDGKVVDEDENGRTLTNRVYGGLEQMRPVFIHRVGDPIPPTEKSGFDYRTPRQEVKR